MGNRFLGAPSRVAAHVNSDEFRRQMSGDMVDGDSNNMAETACSIVANGVFIVPIDGEMFGFQNLFGVPVRLHMRNGAIMTYTPIYPAGEG